MITITIVTFLKKQLFMVFGLLDIYKHDGLDQIAQRHRLITILDERFVLIIV